MAATWIQSDMICNSSLFILLPLGPSYIISYPDVVQSLMPLSNPILNWLQMLEKVVRRFIDLLICLSCNVIDKFQGAVAETCAFCKVIYEFTTRKLLNILHVCAIISIIIPNRD